MQIKDGYVMKKLGLGYVVVTVGQASEDFNGVIRLNETGAFLWQSILDGADTREKLIKAMQARFEDLDEQTCAHDLDEYLNAIAFSLEK